MPTTRVDRLPTSQTRLALLTLGLVVIAVTPSPAAEPSPAGVEFYETQIRPLLAEHCYACHSLQAKRLRGGLRLDSSQGWLTGGDLGPSVTPGDPKASRLVTAVSYADDELKMPPKGKLNEAQIASLTRWVAMGAPAPAGNREERPATRVSRDPSTGRDFWSFQPPVDHPAPAVSDTSWPRNALDRFILSRLESQGVRPAPETDKRSLIRRATFDLTGLPPTPDEVKAFLDDVSEGAFDRVVDRLLASPHYGERYGRHWLDVARYADSNGLDENVAHGNAWRYRDYVIASFNADTPYDQFLLEQLAGDLLPDAGQTPDRLIATGFLTLGPKVLAEPDETKMEMDIVDEQVDTVGRAFMGLTLGCARCHDHKFDPISTADYYGLAGIFKSTRTMETFKKVAKWHENPIAPIDPAEKAAYDEKVALKKRAIDDLIKAANAHLRDAKGEGFTLPAKPEPLYPEETSASLKRLREELVALEKSPPEVPSAMGVTEGKVADTFVHVRGSYLSLGPSVPRRVPSVFERSDPPSFSASQSGRLELARWLGRPSHPLTSRVMVNRIWRWHFGRGLVGTTENFGVLGDRPADPALLDWLARRFTEANWSVKALHRLVMLSATYRTGDHADPRTREIDPENRLQGRTVVRRLEAEAIRDALLAVSGSLDQSVGGSLLQIKNRAYFFDHTSRDGTRYDSHRRAVYLPVVRNHLYDMFELFDYADANVSRGDRGTTTVAPQALFMMNSDLVLQAARDTAANLLSRADLDDPGRISLLYETAYGRPASATELERAGSFLTRFARDATGSDACANREGAWQAFCQVILASNEFIHVR